jgi:uncharacterized protein
VKSLERILADIEARLDGEMPCLESDLHGRAHLRQVALLAGQIARDSGADVESAMVAGLLHDCGREDDAGGNAHALRSAEVARRVVPACFPHLDADRIALIIERHADGLTSADPLAGAVWDADRLTLPRAGIAVRQELLSTRAGKALLRDAAP